MGPICPIEKIVPSRCDVPQQIPHGLAVDIGFWLADDTLTEIRTRRKVLQFHQRLDPGVRAVKSCRIKQQVWLCGGRRVRTIGLGILNGWSCGRGSWNLDV